MKRPALVILDRDGVINEDSDNYIRRPEDWLPIPGSIEAIAALSMAGYRIVVATNQSGIARGYFDEYALAAMHEKLHALVETAGGQIDGIFVCPHGPDDGCRCRKPDTGLLEGIEAEFNEPVSGAWFVGDSLRDLDCALAMHCRPVLVLTGKGEKSRRQLDPLQLEATLVFPDLQTAAQHILQTETLS